MPDSNLTKLSGLWLNTSKQGVKYFSGKANNKALGDLAVLLANNPGKELRILIFKNNKAEGERDPGYNLFVCPDEPKPKESKADSPINDEETPF